MNLIELSVKRPVLTVMVVTVLVVMGIFSYTRLSIDLIPKIDIPVITITTIYEGAGPKEVESQITAKIEDEVASVSNVKSISSTSIENVSVVVVEFVVGTDVDMSAIEVKDKVDAILNSLPEGVDRPKVVKYDINAQPIVNLSLSADRPLNEIYDIADNEVRDRLNRIDGLASIEVIGGLKREIQVNVNKEALIRYGLSITDIENVIAAENRNVPAGRLTQDRSEYTLRVQGEFSSVAELTAATIATPKGGTVTIGDIARVEDSFKERRDSATFNGKPSVGILISKRSDANTVSVATGVYKAISELDKTLPEGYEISLARDNARYIVRSVKDVVNNIIIGILITALLLYIFLHDFRFTIIASLTIPASIIATFILIYAADFTLNLLTLMALGISIGTLVTNSLLVLENIDRYIAMGEVPDAAAVKGASEIALAVAASALTNIVVFTPIAYMQGIVGQFFKQFGLTVVFATVVSLFISFTLTPMLAAKFLGPKKDTGKGKLSKLGQLRYVRKYREFIAKFFAKWEEMFVKVTDGYKTALLWALDNGKKVAIATVAIFLLSFVLLAMVGGEFFPYTDRGYVNIAVTMPAQSTIEDTEDVMSRISDIVKAHPEVVSVLSTVGGETTGVNEGTLVAKLVPLADRDMTGKEFVNIIRPEFASIPSAKIVVGEDQTGGGGSEADITVEVSGPDLETLRKLSGEMLAFMDSTNGLVDVDTSEEEPKPELRFIPDRYRIASLGITTRSVYTALRTSFEGEVPSVFRDKGEEYDIRVRLAGVSRQDKDSFSEVMIATPSGIVPASRLGDVVSAEGESQIKRKNRTRLIEVTANIGSGTLSEYENMITAKRDKMDIPNGYNVALGGDSESKAEAFGSLFQALFMAIVLTYIILAAMLESYIHPITIMTTLPLGLVGVAMGLFIGKQTINMLSLMTVVMLVGVVVNNAILLLDYTNVLRDEGKHRREALVEASYTRFRPIAMMNLAIALAIVPQVLGNAEAGMQKTMGVATIGGILISTVFTLFLIPLIYEYSDRFTKRGRLERR
jgi:hydrophobic/amphiphilic exporter-1 (mainly G- bacteria), HAE1 family